MTAAPIALNARATSPLLVWVLAPVVETDDPDIAWYADYSQSKAEYDRAFGALGLAWRWQPVTMRDHEAVVQRIIRESAGHEPVILNLCDGDEVNGSPGISVIRCLERHGLRYTGADERFYDVTTSKIVMKEAFDRAGVPTSPWAVVPRDGAGIGEIIRRLGVPLILKPAVSAGSMGITTKSVVQSPQALRAALKRLSENGGHGVRAAGPLPFCDGAFQVVCAFEVLEHIPEDQATIAEIARVLRPGGAFFVSVPVNPALFTDFDHVCGHVRRYDAGALAAQLAVVGLHIERWTTQRNNFSRVTGALVGGLLRGLAYFPRLTMRLKRQAVENQLSRAHTWRSDDLMLSHQDGGLIAIARRR